MGPGRSAPLRGQVLVALVAFTLGFFTTFHYVGPDIRVVAPQQRSWSAASARWDPYGSLGRGFDGERCAAAYEALRRRIVDLLPLVKHDPRILSEESALVKFLLANRYDVAATERALRRYLRWRKTSGANTVLDHPHLPEAFRSKLDIGFSGHDREGRPLYVEFLNGTALIELLKTQSLDSIVEFHIFRQERERELLRRWHTDRITSIVDLKNAGIAAFTSPGVFRMMKKLTEHDKAFYPEMLHRYIVINAPSVATQFWRLLAPFLDSATRQKVYIWGSREWRRKISAFVDDRALPARLGGRATEWVPLTDYRRIPTAPLNLRWK